MTREEAIEQLKGLLYCFKYSMPDEKKTAIDMAIEALSADAKTKCIAQIKVDTEEIVSRIKEEYDITDGWIPCSERLPKEKQEVYVTVYFTEGDTGRAYGYIDGFGKWHLYSAVEGVLNSGYKVTAWKPLPKPYKGGE